MIEEEAANRDPRPDDGPSVVNRPPDCARKNYARLQTDRPECLDPPQQKHGARSEYIVYIYHIPTDKNGIKRL